MIRISFFINTRRRHPTFQFSPFTFHFKKNKYLWYNATGIYLLLKLFVLIIFSHHLLHVAQGLTTACELTTFYNLLLVVVGGAF